ncbi:MCE family protein [uncultured Mycolicibacterium sp.]|uniref:MCE family protein n=1 Tax=uncultured Mycolicibacterium sp. TaxID=2320817 RepID=UPI0026373A3B|nr:MCE family protein [uncultured Mycolicibacterium sp.]
MADTGSRKLHVRIAAAVLAVIIAAFVVFTYLSYTAAFVPTETVTVTAPRAGLVMERGAKVKYRGIQIGKVADIAYAGDQARLRLAINRDQLRYVPADATVRIAGNTVFGAKAVEFLPPERPVAASLEPGAHVHADAVQLEVNTLFQTLMDVLDKIDPTELNGTLTAVAEGLRGNGDNLGAALAGANELAGRLNPKMPAVQSLLAQTAAVGNIYGDAAPDLVTVLDNAPTLSRTISDQARNLNASLLAATGLANSGHDALADGADDYIAAIQRARAPLKVLADYSPEYGCLLVAIEKAIQDFAPMIGGTRPGLFTSSNFLLGSPSYTYPESLPIVNASGGPNCRGLPDMPGKQGGGSWYKAPFLVTDNALIPYEPFTELQLDAPSTLQFLFNGAFAERDDW